MRELDRVLLRHALFACVVLAFTLAGCESKMTGSQTDAGASAVDASVTIDAALCATPCTVDQYCCNHECLDKIADEGAPLVSMGECDALAYGPYANLNDTSAPDRPATNILPDFSYAGYRMGGVALPDVPAKVQLGPGAGDDTARIQQAIDEVAAMPMDATGHRGAVELAAGIYEVSDTITIGESGVVLRGAGQGSDGTILLGTATQQFTVISLKGAGSGHDEVENTRVDITSEFVPVGSRVIEVSNAGGFSAGDSIIIERRPNQSWIKALDVAQFGWTPGSYVTYFPRTVTEVSGNTIVFDIPLVDAIDAFYGGGQVYSVDLTGYVSESGVEDLRIDSVFSGPEDENHAWTGIELTRASNCWVRNVTAEHMGFGTVRIRADSRFNTVQDAACINPVATISGSRRYPFQLDSRAGPGNLFQRLYARQARHNFASGSRSTGPTVWLDGVGLEAHSMDGPHQRWATGLLFDNTKTTKAGTSSSAGTIRVHNQGDSGSGHGWTGGQILFYNPSAEVGVTVRTPPGAMSYAIGVTDPVIESNYVKGEAEGMVQSLGEASTPRSLYLAQLRARLGEAAVEAVTIPAQRSGRIWDLLEAWGGEGSFPEFAADYAAEYADATCSTGVVGGSFCCPASCGDSCTGSGCGAAPGGADNCCGGLISDSGRSCEVYEPPCILP